MAFCSSSCGAEVNFTCISAIVELQEVWIMARRIKVEQIQKESVDVRRNSRI